MTLTYIGSNPILRTIKKKKSGDYIFLIAGSIPAHAELAWIGGILVFMFKDSISLKDL